MNCYLNKGVVKKLAGKLPLWWNENKEVNKRCCVAGNNKMSNNSIQFGLSENKKKLSCFLAIFGEEERKRKIVEIINEEIMFDYPEACLQSYQEPIYIKNKKYIFDIYTWTIGSKKITNKPVVVLLKG